METLNWLQQNLHIDPIIVIIVIAAGFFQNLYLKTFKISNDLKTNSALKTLIVSGIVVSLMLLMQHANNEEIWNAFLSYFLATSLHEIILRPITNLIKNSLNDNKSGKS